ncbi:hypothetical protein R2601_03313 [Salipiger bermudensis HTCC2601]|uniref:Uncharacterized protein n=1 Tax=Salipiger bermudensis (strain DSM 26914 / JCM 13377 / KCTC 12554 / HTCC2601) TaxID=314265 RepID=Q0FWI3_SALBH|nr:hypothetical protein R2601_03313 [Salipiger bermudensis HTCC2601]
MRAGSATSCTCAKSGGSCARREASLPP